MTDHERILAAMRRALGEIKNGPVVDDWSSVVCRPDVGVGADCWEPLGPGLTINRDALSLHPTQMAIYAWMTLYADADGNVSLGCMELSRRCGLNYATVNRAINALDAHGWIHVDRTEYKHRYTLTR